ncbi:papain-like cysteine protease family protein [Chitinophaga varians]|uniref:papain-like cysteine protease family protein n=1 Tax=Chitinophaga varians TaxID=2202339 RepID=UPI00165F4605|nr:papain-like cysteine protease family protein [Chitinophaga varians]MBC9909545.1 hypothetical protein [Chitinophaga varians]
MSITTIVCLPHELREELTRIMQEEFEVSMQVAKEAFDAMLEGYFERLKKGVQFVIEYPYVDKVYRDSYYAYFSSKRRLYQKDCIRISVFEGEVLPDQFRSAGGIASLRERYLGFMVLRPTMPHVIGRSVLSPHALRQSGFLSLTGKFQTTVNAVKFEAIGFPHSSQDTETLTCAETSIWALMEYFASRYSEYKPVASSIIVNVLRSQSSFRQIPSEGLTIEQIGFALQEFGFGTKAYSKGRHSSASFLNLLSVYVESGIPIIVAVSNEHRGGNIGHAMLIVGRSEMRDEDIDKLSVTEAEDTVLAAAMKNKGVSIIDCADVKRSFVFIDDNYPAYQLAPLDAPTAYYDDAEWRKCEIVDFLVPLYPKAYLEEVVARRYMKRLLLGELFHIPAGTELLIRLFMVSSRSYKDYLTLETSFQRDFKDIILMMSMSKFIWVGEISSRELIKQHKASGLIILDATEAQVLHNNALVVCGYGDCCYYRNASGKQLVRNFLSLEEFNVFTNNLKGF